MLSGIIKKERYLSSAVVFIIDVTVSIVASACVMGLYDILTAPAAFQPRFMLNWLLCSFLGSITAFYITKTYRAIIRYSTLHELALITDAICGKELIIAAIIAITSSGLISAKLYTILLMADFFVSLSAMILIRVLMVLIYAMINRRNESPSEKTKVLVFRTNEKSVSLVTRLRHSHHFDVAGFLVNDRKPSSSMLVGLPIYHSRNETDLEALKQQTGIQGIIFSHHEDAREEKDTLIEYCRQMDMKTFIAPSIDEINDSKIYASGIRNIRIEDLLGRNEIKISMDEIKQQFNGKTVLVTGAAGSIGSELCRQLAHLGVRKLIMFDNAETPLHNIRLEFEDKYKWVDYTPIIGDVRIKTRLDYVFRTYMPQIVFHAAAYKHVPLMEENPCEAIMVNVTGSRNVADKCVEYDVEKMVMVSTDKAVNPTNIMGCTKRLAEIYVQSLGLALQNGERKGKTRFITTRFGNVLGSNGSVIPRFTSQIASGGPLTVTHPEIRRFFMTIPEACRLVMEAAILANGTQIFVFDMGEPVKITDLAMRMIHLAGYEVGKDIEIKFTGLRPGEKLYEEILATKENTLPTNHERIFKAKVREYDYDEVEETAKKLEELSVAVNIPDMVMLMKRTVPEFKSQCSVFEKYDRILEKENK